MESLTVIKCPKCGSPEHFKDGIRTLRNGEQVQRYICRICSYRYTDPSSLKTINNTKRLYQVSAKAKNLIVPTSPKVGTGILTDETKAAITVFEGWLIKEGYKESRYPNDIKTLVYLGADLKNPEDVKSKIGNHNVKNGTKMLLCYAYEAFLKMNGKTWDRPTYKQEEIIPFIPEETELDQLITAAQSHRMATYLQTLKETYADPGEALAIEWKDISGNVIYINHPCKDHRPRALQVSDKLIAMLNMLPHTSERVFNAKYSNMMDSYLKLRKRLTAKTKNDRFMYIEFRSFRHWAGTMLAEMTNGNVLTVMTQLGHKNVENSMKYINIYKLRFKTTTEYEVVTASTPEEIKAALTSGFDFVCEKAGLMFFKRLKRIAIAGTPINKREKEFVNLYEKGAGDISRTPPPSSFSEVLFFD